MNTTSSVLPISKTTAKRNIDFNDTYNNFETYVAELYNTLRKISRTELDQFVNLIQTAQQKQRTVFIVGNGGSASTASHWATDLGKGLHHRTGRGVKALSLADNTAWISAAANDIGYDSIFSDQLRAHAKVNDILIAISASGNSPNIIKVLQEAKSIGVTTVSIVGFDGGRAKTSSDLTVHIPTYHGKYGIAEDAQLVLNHFLCDYLAGVV